MRACLALLSMATPFILTGCMPIVDIELFNDTSRDIVVSGIAGAETLILDECGHFPYFERRDRFREEVTRFLT